MMRPMSGLGAVLAAALSLAAFAAPTPAVAADGATAPVQLAKAEKHPGEKLYLRRQCIACHGKGGKKAILDYPNLAGQEESYLVNQTMDILEGKRSASPDQTGNPRTEGMRGALVTPEGDHRVTKDEVKQIAEWLSALEPAPAPGVAEGYDAARIDEGKDLYKKYNCKNCHGPEGDRPLKAHPYIAGQKKGYLVNQMVDLRERVRKNGRAATMMGFIRKASDEDIEKMAEYLSTVQR